MGGSDCSQKYSGNTAIPPSVVKQEFKVKVDVDVKVHITSNESNCHTRKSQFKRLNNANNKFEKESCPRKSKTRRNT